MMQHLRVSEAQVDDALVCLLHLWAQRALSQTPTASSANTGAPPNNASTAPTGAASATPTPTAPLELQSTTIPSNFNPQQSTQHSTQHYTQQPMHGQQSTHGQQSMQQSSQQSSQQATHVVFDLHLAFPVVTCCTTAVQLASWQHRQPRTSVDGNGNGANPAKRRRVEPPLHSLASRASTLAAGDASCAHQDTHLASALEPTGNEAALSDAVRCSI